MYVAVAPSLSTGQHAPTRAFAAAILPLHHATWEGERLETCFSEETNNEG